MTIKKRIIEIDPREIKLLELNARFMRHEVFSQLVANIKRDGALLGNTPFCWRLHNDRSKKPVKGANGDGIYEVISGNHRVKAAIEAGLQLITVEITEDYLPPDTRNSIQLSQNLLVGQDDPATLKVIYSSIEDVEAKIYTGIDDATLELLEGVSIAAFGEANLEFQKIILMFLPGELERIDAIFEAIKATSSECDSIWLADKRDYDTIMDGLECSELAADVENAATALMIILEVFMRHITELSEHYLSEDYEPLKMTRTGTRLVPIETIFGYEGFPAPVAAKIKKLVNKLTGQGKIKEAHELLEILIDDYNDEQ